MKKDQMPNLFRVKRIAAGLTMQEVAERLGITTQAVSLWENDEAWPGPRHMPRLADVLKQDREQFAREVEAARMAMSA